MWANPDRAFLKVPLRIQGWKGCGNATIRMLLGYWNIPEKEGESPHSPQGGTPISLMNSYLDGRDDLFSEMREGCTVRDVRRSIDEGVPVLVRTSSFVGRSGHYQIIVGYDSDSFRFNDPLFPFRVRRSYDSFLKTWDLRAHKSRPSHNLALFVRPVQ